LTGIPGLSGYQGPRGDKGPAGEEGAIGDEGAEGAQGPQGDQGKAIIFIIRQFHAMIYCTNIGVVGTCLLGCILFV